LVNSTTIIRGSRQPATGLWTINLNNQPNLPNPSKRILGNAANSVYEMETKADLVPYLHRCSYSPTTSGWLKAIKNGFFTTWPGLDETLSKNISPSQSPPSNAINVSNSKHTIQFIHDELIQTASANARLDKNSAEFKNANKLLRTASDAARLTTKPNKFHQILQDDNEPKTCTNIVYVKAIEATGQIYTNQTGRFPTTSCRGNKYIMILYDYDSNAILAEPNDPRLQQATQISIGPRPQTAPTKT
jgi:hypothetical protein